MKWTGLLLACLLVGCDYGDKDVVLVTGQIECKAASAGSRIGGRVMEVLVREGSRVEKDALLARLDNAEAQALLAAAKAKFSMAEAALAKLEAGATPEQLRQAEAAAQITQEAYLMAQKGARQEEIQAADAALDGARAQRDTAAADYQRVKRIFDRQIATQRDLDQARMQLDTAEAQLRGAQEQFDMVVKGARAEEIAMAKARFDQSQAALEEIRKGARQEDLMAARAAQEAAAADVQRAQVLLSEMSIIAPVAGIIESMQVDLGELIAPGPVARIINPEDLELTVYVSAALLGYLRLGQECVLQTDSLGEEKFTATINHIASEGEFTPRNLQTQEERVQQVFEVRLSLDSAGGKLRAGMAATVRFPRKQETPQS